MYLTKKGEEITLDQIKQAFESGKAALVHSNREGRTDTGLSICGEHFDTRGQCQSAWDEVWTQAPKSLRQCLDVAKV